jgi:TetR/AcrR family transcriptional repressor of lfrA
LTAEPSGPTLSAGAVRTREAILGAAIEMLPADPTVSLSEIADGAGVGRSTLHRHFKDRAELIRALSLHVRDLSNSALEDADPDSGTPIAALRRLVDGQLELGPILSFLNAEPGVRADAELTTQFAMGQEVLVAAIERAAAPDDPTPVTWRLQVFWELVRLGSQYAGAGVARHKAIDAIMHTMTHGIATASGRAL